MQSEGEYDETIAECDEAIRLNPGKATRYITFAWLLATCPDGQFRDGARAVQLAEKACELIGDANLDAYFTLAAAHAENGNFLAAVAWQRKVIELAAPEERNNMCDYLEWYEAGKPYHEV